ncbi:type II toxin-antitoxin system VapC family toxin [Pseudonocardia spinosispora]|uniref:type II toxin-antitoxin system VapC family toxin n=1 Tax=Pseudonocardia spinosispora TaxID=103441 RepID=UPI00048A920A|nr:PIN domain-containing protein [Pseudonocardia spinosispora]
MIVVDTGPIVAAAAIRDPDHAACLEALTSLSEAPLITPFVVMEVCYFLSTRASAAAEASFLRSLDSGTFRLVDLASSDLRRMADLIEKYASLPLGAADASVIAVAERFGATVVMTLDHRHFSVVRPRHVDYFTLLP